MDISERSTVDIKKYTGNAAWTVVKIPYLMWKPNPDESMTKCRERIEDAIKVTARLGLKVQLQARRYIKSLILLSMPTFYQV